MFDRGRARQLQRSIAVVLLLMAVAACGSTRGGGPSTPRSGALTGPLAWLLADSTDLGPSARPHIAAAVSLDRARRPAAFGRWAHRHELRVGWRPGNRWASLSGSAPALGAALGVAIHDYRSRSGNEFYAAQRQPVVPAAIRGEVTQIGRLLNYSPHIANVQRAALPFEGLTPRQLVTAYGANNLVGASGGTTRTVVFFEWGPYEQADLDTFAQKGGLPKFTPEVFGGAPDLASAGAETELDVEVTHAIAPNARLIVANANPTFNGSTLASVGLAIAKLFTSVDRQYPGAVWSLSIGWGCDRIFTHADLQPVEAAVQAAEAHGTSVFDASGDTAGLECKGNKDYSTPPGASDVGVDAIGSLPGITSVGGTLISTDAQGNWAAEEAWDDSALSQGGSGGVSRLQTRPSWQVADGISALRGAGHRLVPDVSADADPESGVAVTINGQPGRGGGTSQAAPIWAGFTVLMDDYLVHQGGHPIGLLNPQLYKIAQLAQRPAFHDITLGGDAEDFARPGYDLVTGLGTPMVDNLVQDLLDLQRSRT